MFNDFVVVGPKADPAGVRGVKEAREVLRRIEQTKAIFISRGDDSGTHRMEMRLWKSAGIDKPAGDWYREIGQGMGPTLNVAAALNGYTLADRGTWASFKNRQELDILADGDPLLFNPYGSIIVNPVKGAHIRAADAKVWHDWLSSEEGRHAITSFRIGGQQLFFTPGSSPRS
jgi:tungstate transport system substrate-binding protein